MAEATGPESSRPWQQSSDDHGPPQDIQTPPVSPANRVPSPNQHHESPTERLRPVLMTNHPMPVTIEECEDEEINAHLLTPLSPSSTSVFSAVANQCIGSPNQGIAVTHDLHIQTPTSSNPVAVSELLNEEHATSRRRPDAMSFLDAATPAVAHGFSPSMTHSSVHHSPRGNARRLSKHRRSPSLNNQPVFVPESAEPYAESSIDGRSQIPYSDRNSEHFSSPVPRRPQFDQGPGPPGQSWLQDPVAPGEHSGPVPFSPAESYARSFPAPHMTPGSFSQFPQAPSHVHHRPQPQIPLTGYQLLAVKLAGGATGPPISPLYRRFESLNHRLLLKLQDELAEHEEQLDAIDTRDTQMRWQPGQPWEPERIQPASRRHESAELRDRCLLLNTVGQKIFQYNQVLASFQKVQQLATPHIDEINGYRSFIANSSSIVDEEARFLNADDLISLHPSRRPLEHAFHPPPEDITPMPRPGPDMGFPPIQLHPQEEKLVVEDQSLEPVVLARLAMAMCVALLVPILTFAVIPGFPGRMIVVVLVGTGVGVAMAQSGLLGLLSRAWAYLDCVMYVGLYGGVMAVIAAAFG